jgi:hypothetical protein
MVVLSIAWGFVCCNKVPTEQEGRLPSVVKRIAADGAAVRTIVTKPVPFITVLGDGCDASNTESCGVKVGTINRSSKVEEPNPAPQVID